MTTSEPFDDLTSHRITRALRAAARQIELTPGSELAVVTRGRRRQHRRRRATVLVSVAALGAGTLVAVRQLAGISGPSIATQDQTTADATPGSTAEAPPATASFDPATVTVQPAQLVESNIEWTRVEPDSTQAVAYGELPIMADVPGVLLASAPGRSDEWVAQYWSSSDGVAWTPLDVAVPVGRMSDVRFDGADVYAVGTAPGITADQANPMVLATSEDQGATWHQVALPIDTNDVPTEFVSNTYISGAAYPIDDGVIVVVNRSVELDYDRIARLVGVDPQGDYGIQMDANGVTSLVDPECVPIQGSVMPIDRPSTTAAPATGNAEYGGCATRLTVWDDVGVPGETLAAAFSATASVFRVTGDDVVPVDAPTPMFNANGNSGPPEFSGSSDGGMTWQAYRLEPSGEFVESDPVPDGHWLIGVNSTSRFVTADVQQGMYDIVGLRQYGASVDSGEWQYADWSGIHGDGIVATTSTLGVTEAGLVHVEQVSQDGVALKGGVSVSFGGYTISRTAIDEPIVMVDDATGIAVALDRVQLTSDGLLTIVGERGDRVASVPEREFSTVLYPNWDVSEPDDWTVAMSSDGVHVAVESIPKLLGIEAAEISSVPRITSAGATTVIAVTLKERNAEGVPRQLVLVGTPRT